MSTAPGEPAGLSLNYQAYLFRLWRESEQSPWRASLTHVASGECRRFADPAAAWAYLQTRLAAAPDHPHPAEPD